MKRRAEEMIDRLLAEEQRIGKRHKSNPRILGNVRRGLINESLLENTGIGLKDSDSGSLGRIDSNHILRSQI